MFLNRCENRRRGNLFLLICSTTRAILITTISSAWIFRGNSNKSCKVALFSWQFLTCCCSPRLAGMLTLLHSKDDMSKERESTSNHESWSKCSVSQAGVRFAIILLRVCTSIKESWFFNILYPALNMVKRYPS